MYWFISRVQKFLLIQREEIGYNKGSVKCKSLENGREHLVRGNYLNGWIIVHFSAQKHRFSNGKGIKRGRKRKNSWKKGRARPSSKKFLIEYLVYETSWSSFSFLQGQRRPGTSSSRLNGKKRFAVTRRPSIFSFIHSPPFLGREFNLENGPMFRRKERLTREFASKSAP